MGGHFRTAHHAYAAWSSHCPGKSVLDLGSGGGGPVQTMLLNAHHDGVKMPKIYLSDLNPSLEHYQRLQRKFGENQLGYIAKPISALEASVEPSALYSICSTLHHFREEDVRRMLDTILQQARGLFILEPLQRDWLHFAMVFLSGPFPYLLAPFSADNWSWRKFMITTVIPIAPLMVAFDGCVSVLRSYNPNELISMMPMRFRSVFTIAHGVLPYMRRLGAIYISLSRA